ncbi:helix-turn-helix transcriptional regulator [Phaeodactylibacter sp.]|uniref:helix-turn-helix transcriptional regulator n=1 Tax=Phaeodactylibacter sp. TaxID=1940289 RepID=UPI0025F39DA2|nr:helix-turn-helix transcriptional regulator [Phaeodactylibacter sp.]MCI5089379.1 helix-turn-helix transcriptional regulator [Phaeodactylibacter sp.]
MIQPLQGQAFEYKGINDPCKIDLSEEEQPLSPEGLLKFMEQAEKAGSPEVHCYDSLYRSLFFSSDSLQCEYHKARLRMVLYSGKTEVIEGILDEYKSLADNTNAVQIKGGYWLSRGNAYFANGEKSLAESAYRKAIVFFDQVEDQRRLYLVYSNLSMVYLYSKKYEAAYQYLLLSQQLAGKTEKLISEQEKAVVLNNIGLTYLRRDMYQVADSIFAEVRKKASAIEDGAYPMVLSLINQIEVAGYLEDWGRGEELLEVLDPYMGEFNYLLPAYTEAAFKIYLGKRQYDRAKYVLDSLRRYEINKGASLSYDFYSMKIEYYLALNQPDQALTAINLAEGLAREDAQSRVALSESRVKALLLKGEAVLASVEMRELERRHKAFQQLSKKLRVEEMAAIYELETFKNQRDRAERIAKVAEERASLLERNRLYLGTALLFAVVALIILGLLLHSHQRRVTEARAKAEAARKHSEQLDRQLKVQRQNALQTGIGAAQLKNNAMEVIARYESNLPLLKRKLSILIHDYTEKNDFVELFLLSYPDFFRALADMAPDLTKTQLRYAILIALGASTVEIASTQGVSEKAVNMARYRLKSKLELDNDHGLDLYLRQLLLQ